MNEGDGPVGGGRGGAAAEARERGAARKRRRRRLPRWRFEALASADPVGVASGPGVLLFLSYRMYLEENV